MEKIDDSIKIIKEIKNNDGTLDLEMEIRKDVYSFLKAESKKLGITIENFVINLLQSYIEEEEEKK